MAASSVARFPGLQMPSTDKSAYNTHSYSEQASGSRLFGGHTSMAKTDVSSGSSEPFASSYQFGSAAPGKTGIQNGSSYYNGGNGASTFSASTAAPEKLERIDTQDLKAKLSSALGANGQRYWSTLLQFMTAKIDRTEFEEEASRYLLPQHVHLHNSLILGLLYNASADVPGPSSRSANGLRPARGADGMPLDGRDDVMARLLSDTEDADESIAPPKKRLRMLTAGLSRKERARIRSIPKTLGGGRATNGSAVSSLGWAGAGADMLEKKRKEEEKRKSVQERKKAKEAHSEIGAPDWKSQALSAQSDINNARDRLSLSVQQELARALTAPMCVQSKQLPDLDGLRDVMSLHAVEAGLLRGSNSQAAGLLLAALQCHLQNVMASVITKIRANRQMGIRTTGVQRPAADEYALLADAAAEQPSAMITVTAPGSADDSFESGNEEMQSSSRQQRLLRGMVSDTSQQTMSTSASSILGNSMADSSMISLVSTDPTSVAPTQPPSEAASGDDARSANGIAEGKPVRSQVTGNSTDDDENVNDDSSSSAARSTEQGATTLELRHLAFLLDLAPHTVVEGLGAGTQERLLASDWTHVDEDAQRALEWTGEGALQRQARAAATAKMSAAAAQSPATGLRSTTGSAPSGGQAAARLHYVIDQLAPVRVLDRRTLSETQASRTSSSSQQQFAGKSYDGRGSWHATRGGLSLPSAGADAAKDKERAISAFDKQNIEGDDDDKKDIGATSLWAASAKAAAATAAASLQTSPPASAASRGDRTDPHLCDVIDPAALLASLVG